MIRVEAVPLMVRLFLFLRHRHPLDFSLEVTNLLRFVQAIRGSNSVKR